MKVPNEQFWKVFKSTEGAFSCSEAVALYNICLNAPSSRCAEFGVYMGKSAMAAAAALNNCLFYLVEPEFKNKKISSLVEDALKSVATTGMDYSFHCTTSIEWLNDNERMFGYVMIDSGSHGDGLPMQEVKLLEDRMVSGGIIAFHDFRSQFIEVEQAYNYLLSTGKYEEIKIDWDEINKYVIENNLEDGNKSWHHTELATPNFLGALKRK